MVEFVAPKVHHFNSKVVHEKNPETEVFLSRALNTFKE